MLARVAHRNHYAIPRRRNVKGFVAHEGRRILDPGARLDHGNSTDLRTNVGQRSGQRRGIAIPRGAHRQQDQFPNFFRAIGCERLVERCEGCGGRLPGWLGIQSEQRLESACGARARIRIGIFQSGGQQQFGVVGWGFRAAGRFENRSADGCIAFRFDDRGPREGSSHLRQGARGSAPHPWIGGIEQRNESVAIGGIFKTADRSRRDYPGARISLRQSRQQSGHAGLACLFGIEEPTIRAVLCRRRAKEKQDSSGELGGV